MRRIGITQRQDPVAGRSEVRDALDRHWAPLLERLGLVPVPVPNGLSDPVAWASALELQGLLLTGGNDVSGQPSGSQQRAPERDRAEGLLLDLAAAQRWPVLGICRGFQHMNVRLGGGLSPVRGHVATVHRVHAVQGSWGGEVGRRLASCGAPVPEQVNSYHQFGMERQDLAAGLEPWLVDDQGWSGTSVAMMPGKEFSRTASFHMPNLDRLDRVD